MSPWYENPAWFALLLGASSFAVSILAFFTARRSTRITVHQRITQQIAEINESFVKYEVKGPYATQLGIADTDVKKYAAKSMVLFHQLNLLRLVFQNRDVIGRRALASFESWAKNILGKWIASDSELLKTWNLFCNTRDLDGQEFHDWLQQLIPSSEEKKHAARGTLTDGEAPAE